MKLTRTTKRASGMTLLELTVVILVLLSLISILFIGARAWKRGSDRAGAILTIRNVQQAVRSFANMNGIDPNTLTVAGDLPGGDPLKDQIVGPGKFIENDPEDADAHPASGFTFAIANADLVPDVGVLYMDTTGTGSGSDNDPTYYSPNPDDITDW
jgi:type II secretory pathway pseudopilin PulG